MAYMRGVALHCFCVVLLFLLFGHGAEKIVSLFCAARRSGHLYHKQESSRSTSQAHRFFSCGIAENCPDFRAAKKKAKTLCVNMLKSLFFYILYLWVLVKNSVVSKKS